jgi:hypothetical protein
VPNSEKTTQETTETFARLVEQSMTLAQETIEAWAALTKNLIAQTPFGTLTDCWMRVVRAYFDCAKALQTIPEVGGAGKSPETT